MPRLLPSFALAPPRSTTRHPPLRPTVSFQCLHTTTSKLANPLPILAAGPPPAAPLPPASQYGERMDRRRRQAELLKHGQDVRSSQQPTEPGNALKRRFWKDVSVQTAPEGYHTIQLDARPVRAPSTKSVLPIPASKPHLATAIALEWDLLVSAKQALKTHLVPLTSLAARAHDIALQDAGEVKGTAREDLVRMLMRYLDTDTLLCWAPAKTDGPGSTTASGETVGVGEEGKESLRDIQIRVARPIIAFLTEKVWPGVEIRPVLDEGSIIPTSQPQATSDVIRGWISGLGPWELAGLERAVLAGKSLCVGARLVVEWSENFFGGLGELAEREDGGRGSGKRFGIEEAAEACSLEVSWQTGMWGEVEDSHDVDKEDLRRQLGSVVLLVSGSGDVSR